MDRIFFFNFELLIENSHRTYYKTFFFIAIFASHSFTTLLSQVSPPPPSTSFVYENCGCIGEITLKIYNGLYGDYGGQEVIDAVNIGAVTVANLNDTDGDGDPDLDGVIDVMDKDDNSVVATAFGRDEVDLMKMEISSTGQFPPNCSEVKLVTTGPIKIWNSSTKGQLVPETFPISSLPKTVYVEAYNYSNSVRDIIIKAEVIDNSGVPVEFGQVKATAIWVDRYMVYKDRTETTTPSQLFIDNLDMINNITNTHVSFDGSLYGYGTLVNIPGLSPPDDSWFGGRILFNFQLLPPGIENHLTELGIKYDCSRRIKRQNQFLEYGSPRITTNISNFPMQNEEANDDGESPPDFGDFLDEDAIPLPGHREIFHYDSPSELRYGSDRAFSQRLLQFEEFVRVSFKEDIVGNGIGGSICSEKWKWSLNYSLATTNFLQGENPHNKSSQILNESAGGLTCSLPRKHPLVDATGTVVVQNVTGPSGLAFAVKMINLDTWELVEIVTGPQISLGFSNSSYLGPWFITGPNFNIVIMNDLSVGGTLFGPGDFYVFSIWDVPISTNTLTTLN